MRTRPQNLLFLAPLLLPSMGATCGNGPYDECAIEIPSTVLVDDGLAEDASLILADDGTIIASYITGSIQTRTELRRLDDGVWDSVAIENSNTDPLLADANFQNVVQTDDGRFHLIGAFAPIGDTFGGSGRLYQLSSRPDAAGNYIWNDWPDLASAQPITDDAGFDFGPVSTVDELGRIWVVFISDRGTGGTNDHLWITHYDPALGWQAPVAITSSDKRDTFPQLNLDKEGRLNLAWVRTLGDRSALLVAGQEQEVVAMTSAVLDASFTGVEWGAEKQLALSSETSINTLSTVFEGPDSSYVAWISQDYAVADAPGHTPVASLADGTFSEFPNAEQLNRALRLPGDRYLRSFTNDFGTDHPSIRYRIYNCNSSGQ